MHARGLVFGVVALGCWALDAHSGPLDAVGPQDRLQIKVLEWLPAKGEYREWAAVGGDYTVAPDGTIALPFAGGVPVTGRSLSALSDTISDTLQRSLSLPTRLEVKLEVISRSPVYVVGGVEAPGKVDFTPGLTAMQAVALAGGFYRGGGGGMRLERDTINAQGDLRTARDTAARLRARLVRLEAELTDAKDMPDGAKADPDGKPFTDEERVLFNVRREARLSQLESAKNRRQLAIDQLAAIDEKANDLDRQIELTRRQLGDIQTLVDKGLTVMSRQFDLERSLSDLEGRRIDLQIGRLATNLEINEAERSQLNLVTDFRTEVANDLQTARAQLADATLAIDRASALLNESTVIAPEKLINRAGNMNVLVHFFLTRSTGEHSATVEINKDDPVLAGDTIQVQMDIDGGGSVEQTNSTR